MTYAPTFTQTTVSSHEDVRKSASGTRQTIESNSPPVVPYNITACSFCEESPSISQTVSLDESSIQAMNILALSISSENASRMLEASRKFNVALRHLQKTQCVRNSMPIHTENVINKVPTVSVPEKMHQSVCSLEGNEFKRPCDKDPSYHSEMLSDYGDTSWQNIAPLHKLFIQALHSCNNALLSSFLKRMQALHLTDVEIEACLLLFVDIGKSSKILAGFQLLASGEKVDREPTRSEDSSKLEQSIFDVQSSDLKIDTLNEHNNISTTNLSPHLPYEQLKILLQCFLTTIFTCIDHDSKSKEVSVSQMENSQETIILRPSKAQKRCSTNSPTSLVKDSDNLSDCASDSKNRPTVVSEECVLSEQTRKEIEKVVSYASNKIKEFVLSKNENNSCVGSPYETKNDIHSSLYIGFDKFGEWYNSGGFSLVPWLELLDLNKWKFERKESSIIALSDQKLVNDSKVNHTQEQLTLSNDFPTIVSSDKVKSVDIECIGAASNVLTNNAIETPKMVTSSRILVSFDFSEAGKSIKISEENLLVLKNLVNLTALQNRTMEDISKVFLKYSTLHTHTSIARSHSDKTGKTSTMVLHRTDFGKCIRYIVTPEIAKKFSKTEAETISHYFTNFFSCFCFCATDSAGFDYVDATQLAIGFSFLCKGKKSAKLATAFEVLDENKTGFLTRSKVSELLQIYLTMLVGISLLSRNSDVTPDGLMSNPPVPLLEAVKDGARWTLDHFFTSLKGSNGNSHVQNDEVTFESFAEWYTGGGYNHAPWLEFLDLNKFFSLARENYIEDIHFSQRKMAQPDMTLSKPNLITSSLQRTRKDQIEQPHVTSPILFTFPLANRQSLVVLREDASYVHFIVHNLGMVDLFPEEVWRSMFSYIRSKSVIQSTYRGTVVGKSCDIDKETFLSSLELVLNTATAAGLNEGMHPFKDTLGNLFLSFDLDQVNRVAANQLMGGLTLLSSGKKSTKLAFSFGLFDGRSDDVDITSKSQSLDGKEMFYFLRSFLIVMFSCCKQSLQLSAGSVARNISDTAYMVTDNVMRYQWKMKGKSRVDFDDFGEWYNEGGFESAPWLELLDLNKWALREKPKGDQRKESLVESSSFASPYVMKATGTALPSTEMDAKVSLESECPPAPPDEDFDPSSDDFFGDHMEMDGIDDMDFVFNDSILDAQKQPLAASPDAISQGRVNGGNPLNFLIPSNSDREGFVVAVTARRVSLLRCILLDSNFSSTDVSVACKLIMSQASSKKLAKDKFELALKDIPLVPSLTKTNRQILFELFSAVFDAFDSKKTGKADVKELVCGFSVLCGGRKSDKLEFAFDLLDKDDIGLARPDMMRYLQCFLTVLLCILSCSLGGEPTEEIISCMTSYRKQNSLPHSKVAQVGCSWATGQVFSSDLVKQQGNQSERISFDIFAAWYTAGGYTCIPWLELLDLRKWLRADLR